MIVLGEEKVFRSFVNSGTRSFSSSLQRLETSHLKLERRFSEIGAKIEKFGKDTAQINPTVSIAGSGVSGMGFISATFMMNAEIGQRRWASIGVDEWIQAGRWWLMKVGASAYLRENHR